MASSSRLFEDRDGIRPTSAGLLLPLLKDAHQESTQFGQLV